MNTNVIEELRWRGMVQDIMPGLEEQLQKEMTAGYVGFDPTSDSLHVGNLLPIMLLTHFQRAGHKPYALVGGATGMVGDPSGKSAERNLQNEETLAENVQSITAQLSRFLDFENGENKAELVNNNDWISQFSFLQFIRDVGKHITISYMMAKDSVKKRIETGISFTEFSYQLIQGYDFFHLFKHHNVKVQFGGSDQWGNITTGTEMIRRMDGGDAYAFTCPLLTKADGGKFGKTESGTVWLDASKTSPFAFYQFWLNATDADAAKLVRFYTLKTKEEIEAIEAEHNEAPHLRTLQKAIAEEVTVRVHGEDALRQAIAITEALFAKDADSLLQLTAEDFESMTSNIRHARISRSELEGGISAVELIGNKSGFLASNGEAKRELKSNSISMNKVKLGADQMVQTTDLIKDKYLFLSKGKRDNYFIVIAE